MDLARLTDTAPVGATPGAVSMYRVYGGNIESPSHAGNATQDFRTRIFTAGNPEASPLGWQSMPRMASHASVSACAPTRFASAFSLCAAIHACSPSPSAIAAAASVSVGARLLVVHAVVQPHAE